MKFTQPPVTLLKNDAYLVIRVSVKLNLMLGFLLLVCDESVVARQAL